MPDPLAGQKLLEAESILLLDDDCIIYRLKAEVAHLQRSQEMTGPWITKSWLLPTHPPWLFLYICLVLDTVLQAQALMSL